MFFLFNLAPEVILKQRYLFAPDWFGLGCLIYEMIEGHSPFRKNKERAKRPEIEKRILETKECYSEKFTPKCRELCEAVRFFKNTITIKY
jgi:G protein-coupled receptor kinase